MAVNIAVDQVLTEVSLDATQQLPAKFNEAAIEGAVWS